MSLESQKIWGVNRLYYKSLQFMQNGTVHSVLTIRDTELFERVRDATEYAATHSASERAQVTRVVLMQERHDNEGLRGRVPVARYSHALGRPERGYTHGRGSPARAGHAVHQQEKTEQGGKESSLLLSALYFAGGGRAEQGETHRVTDAEADGPDVHALGAGGVREAGVHCARTLFSTQPANEIASHQEQHELCAQDAGASAGAKSCDRGEGERSSRDESKKARGQCLTRRDGGAGQQGQEEEGSPRACGNFGGGTRPRLKTPEGGKRTNESASSGRSSRQFLEAGHKEEDQKRTRSPALAEQYHAGAAWGNEGKRACVGRLSAAVQGSGGSGASGGSNRSGRSRSSGGSARSMSISQASETSEDEWKC